MELGKSLSMGYLQSIDMITEIEKTWMHPRQESCGGCQRTYRDTGFIDGYIHIFGIKYFEEQTASQCSLLWDLTVVTGQCGLGFALMKPEQFEDSIKINLRYFFWRLQTLSERLDNLGEFLDHAKDIPV